MEFNIIKFNQFVSWLLSSHFEKLFVVKAKFKLGHTAQSRSHLYSSKNFRLQYITIVRYKDIQLLYNIQENFIFLMLDTICSPVDNITGCSWNVGTDIYLAFVSETTYLSRNTANLLLIAHLVCCRLYEFLEDLHFCDLWVSMVHHFI